MDEKEMSFEEMANAEGGEPEFMTPEMAAAYGEEQAKLYARPIIQPPGPAPSMPSHEEALARASAVGVAPGLLPFDLETEGRFDIPDKIFFAGYSLDDSQTLTLSRDEDLIENAVHILDRLKTGTDVSIGNALVEELNVILMGMKGQYVDHDHLHRWFCKCQSRVPELDRVLSKQWIQIHTVQYRTVSEAEAEYRKNLLEDLKSMTPEEWQDYIVSAFYPEPPPADATPESEAAAFRIKEPFTIIDSRKRVLGLRFNRVKDIVLGFKVASRELSGQLKRARNAQFPGLSPEQAKEKREEEVELIELELAKRAITYTRAQCLLTIDGMTVADSQKIREWGRLDVRTTDSIDDYLDSINFGIHDERDLTCDLCQRTERRWLHQSISSMDLLPTKVDPGNLSVRKPGKRSRNAIRSANRIPLVG